MSLAAPPSTRSRILVVDDEIGPRESLRMLLKPAHEIKTADSARAALEEIAAFHPDLVIADIKMPEMDGLEMLRRIKQIDASIEVVMITAYASLETVKTALGHGACEYLIKPFSRQDLEDVVRRALLRRQTDLGTRGQVARLVEEMRSLSSKTLELEEAARREAAEQSVRFTQLSILRRLAHGIVGQLDLAQITTAVADQLQDALGYDRVAVELDGRTDAANDAQDDSLTLRTPTGVDFLRLEAGAQFDSGVIRVRSEAGTESAPPLSFRGLGDGAILAFENGIPPDPATRQDQLEYRAYDVADTFTVGTANGRLKTGLHFSRPNETPARVSYSVMQAMGVPMGEWGKGSNKVTSPIPGLLT